MCGSNFYEADFMWCICIICPLPWKWLGITNLPKKWWGTVPTALYIPAALTIGNLSAGSNPMARYITNVEDTGHLLGEIQFILWLKQKCKSLTKPTKLKWKKKVNHTLQTGHIGRKTKSKS